jgi:hypothetical protein
VWRLYGPGQKNSSICNASVAFAKMSLGVCCFGNEVIIAACVAVGFFLLFLPVRAHLAARPARHTLIHTGAARSALSAAATQQMAFFLICAAFFLLRSSSSALALFISRQRCTKSSSGKNMERELRSRVNFAREDSSVHCSPRAHGNLLSYYSSFIIVLSCLSSKPFFSEEERKILPNGTGTLTA